MSFLSIFGKGVKTLINKATPPESFKIQKFDEYVRAHLFKSNDYELLESAHDKDHVRSSLKPDFTFRDKGTKKEFYVEVKFRTRDNHGKVNWCDEEELIRYNEYNKEKPLFLVLGMGTKPSHYHPQLVSLIPLSQTKNTGLFYSLIDKFLIDPSEPILSKTLWTR